MVSNEIFVGAGTSATFVPEMDMFYNDGTVDANTLNKVTINETALIQLLDNLYVGCRAKVKSGSSTTYTTVKSNDRTSFTFTDDIGTGAHTDTEVIIYAFGAPVPAAVQASSSNPQLLSDNWLGLVNTFTPPNVEVEMKQLNLAVSGTRNFAHQFKGAETVSGGSMDISLNNGSWLYYALGNISSIAQENGTTTDWAAGSNGFL